MDVVKSNVFLVEADEHCISGGFTKEGINVINAVIGWRFAALQVSKKIGVEKPYIKITGYNIEIQNKDGVNCHVQVEYKYQIVENPEYDKIKEHYKNNPAITCDNQTTNND